MVLVQSPLNKRLSHPLSITYSNLYSNDKRRIKALKINKIKKRNNSSFNSTSEKFESLKNNNYFGSQCEKEIIPRTQNNTERKLRKSGAFIEDLDHCTWTMKDNKEDENSLDFQYGTLIGNEEVATCVEKFLSDWDSFIGDLGEDKMDSHMDSVDSFTIQNKSKKEEGKTSSFKEWLPNNSGYLTPTSQKDDECCSEKSETFEQEQDSSTSEKEINGQTEMEEFSKYSPVIIDDFDEICPFENDYNEDERIRSILNAEVLPTDYIGKIPSIPEKPIGYLGRLMKKYNF